MWELLLTGLGPMLKKLEDQIGPDAANLLAQAFHDLALVGQSWLEGFDPEKSLIVDAFKIVRGVNSTGLPLEFRRGQIVDSIRMLYVYNNTPIGPKEEKFISDCGALALPMVLPPAAAATPA